MPARVALPDAPRPHFYERQRLSFASLPFRFKNKGRFTGEVDRGELRRLISEFERIGFFSLADNYDGKEACPTLWSDSPYVFITLNLDGKSKKVGRNAGCEGTNTLKELTALEDGALRTAKVNRWLK